MNGEFGCQGPVVCWNTAGGRLYICNNCDNIYLKSQTLSVCASLRNAWRACPRVCVSLRVCVYPSEAFRRDTHTKCVFVCICGPPQIFFSTEHFSSKIYPEGVTAAACHQGVLMGREGVHPHGEGVSPPKIAFTKKVKLFKKN